MSKRERNIEKSKKKRFKSMKKILQKRKPKKQSKNISLNKLRFVQPFPVN